MRLERRLTREGAKVSPLRGKARLTIRKAAEARLGEFFDIVEIFGVTREGLWIQWVF